MDDLIRSSSKRRTHISPIQRNFYNEDISFEDRKRLEAILSEGMSEEIHLLRTLMRQVVDLAIQASDPGAELDEKMALKSMLDRQMRVLSAISLASSRLGALLRTQKALNPQAPDLGQQLSAILDEYTRRDCLNDGD